MSNNPYLWDALHGSGGWGPPPFYPPCPSYVNPPSPVNPIGPRAVSRSGPPSKQTWHLGSELSTCCALPCPGVMVINSPELVFTDHDFFAALTEDPFIDQQAS